MGKCGEAKVQRKLHFEDNTNLCSNKQVWNEELVQRDELTSEKTTYKYLYSKRLQFKVRKDPYRKKYTEWCSFTGSNKKKNDKKASDSAKTIQPKRHYKRKRFYKQILFPPDIKVKMELFTGQEWPNQHRPSHQYKRDYHLNTLDLLTL